MSVVWVKTPTPEGVSVAVHLPVRVGRDMVTIWVSENYCRYFTHQELPDWIKQPLGMIAACDNAHLAVADRIDYRLAPNGVLLRSAYESSKRECPPGFEDIGWRVNEKYYYLVLPEERVEWLKTGAEFTEKFR
jgi:hypothetical protein